MPFLIIRIGFYFLIFFFDKSIYPVFPYFEYFLRVCVFTVLPLESVLTVHDYGQGQ